MLRHIYATGPARLEHVLSDLLEDQTLEIGVTFNQQEVTTRSVLDAVVRQSPFEVSFEAKRGGTLDEDQILRHLKGIAAAAGAREGARFLVGLTKTRLPQPVRAKFEALGVDHGVRFVNLTFERVAEAVKAAIRPHETDLLEIAEDFESFLGEADLLPVEERSLNVVPCGTSWNENLAFRLYYEPPSRPVKRGRYLGLYRDKAVRLIGEVKAIAICEMADGQLKVIDEDGRLSEAEKARILGVAQQTTYYDLGDTPHRYYLVDAFVETEIDKRSPGGLWGARRFDLDADFGIKAKLTVDELADHLRGQRLPDRNDPTS